MTPAKAVAVFMCKEHQFVATLQADGTLTCRNSPGHRSPDCAECDEAVDQGFNAMMGDA
jgi:hypothetical protein